MDRHGAARRRGRPRRGSSRALSQDRILAAAAEIVRVEGFERLSMRELAAVLGVDPASLYWYFPNKQALLAATLALSSDEIEITPPSEGAWQDQCLAFCQSVRRQLLARPELIEHQWHLTPLVVHASRVLIDLLAPTGLPREALMLGSQTLLWQTLGLVRLNATWPDRRPPAEVVAELNPLVGSDSSSGFDEGEWREFATAYEQGEYDSLFEFAIHTTLRGLEQSIP
jgi:AcrR family transcriptional regulator